MTIDFNFIVHFLGETGLRGFFQLVANDGEDAEDQTCKNHICFSFFGQISASYLLRIVTTFLITASASPEHNRYGDLIGGHILFRLKK